ncbi:MAG: hypothetical protein C0616_05425 [Desulfuromonas sp.]|nr:MAG: hypothetical protein C0616_05425 [Desulfuromonas sp.]
MEETKPDQTDNAPETESKFPELDELQNQVSRRLRDNQKFIENFLDEDFDFDDEEDEDSTD